MKIYHSILILTLIGLARGEIIALRSQKDGNYLDTMTLVTEGSKVTVFPRNNNADNQKWEVNVGRATTGTPSDFVTYAQDGGRLKVLDEDQSATTVATWGGIGVSNQRWTLRQITSGVYQLVNSQSGRCLSNQGAGVQVKCLPCSNDQSQSWSLTSFDSSPPANWLENWAEHRQNLRRVYQDKHVAIYYDPDMPSSVVWPFKFVSDSWAYVKNTYGNFGPDGVLYSNFHRAKYGGGHPGYFFSSVHGFKNVIDCGHPASDAFQNDQGWFIDVLLHEISHIVESAYRGFEDTPFNSLWGDSNFAPIFMIDVYYGIGRVADGDKAVALYGPMADQNGVKWTNDWFYPIWLNHGKGSVLNRFLLLTSLHFPRNGRRYARKMNLGEFVHFWSGAAGTNLKSRAVGTFNWTAVNEAEFNTARSAFPGTSYSG